MKDWVEKMNANELKKEAKEYVKEKYFSSDFSFGFSSKDFVEAILHFAEPREKRIAGP